MDTAPFRNKLIDLLKSNGFLHKTSKEFDNVQILKFSLLISYQCMILTSIFKTIHVLFTLSDKTWKSVVIMIFKENIFNFMPLLRT